MWSICLEWPQIRMAVTKHTWNAIRSARLWLIPVSRISARTALRPKTDPSVILNCTRLLAILSEGQVRVVYKYFLAKEFSEAWRFQLLSRSTNWVRRRNSLPLIPCFLSKLSPCVALHVRRSKAFLDNFNSPAPILKTYSCSQRGGQLSSPVSSGALLSQRKKSKLAVTATPFPRSSTELLSQALNDSSVMISSSYKLSKYDLMKPGSEIQSKIVKVRLSSRETKRSISRKHGAVFIRESKSNWFCACYATRLA